MLSLDMAQHSRLSRVSGFVPTSQDFIDLLNDACRELMRRGEWVATTRRMCVCVYNGCITLPRQVATVLALNRNHRSALVRNNWYGFHTIQKGDCDRSGRVLCNSDITSAQGNLSPVFNPIDPAVPKYLRFYPTFSGDVGKTLRIFGKDSQGQTLMSVQGGLHLDGLLVTLAAPYVQTAIKIHYVDHIIKDATQGPVRGYQWDGTNLWDLCYYEPAEQAPEYRTIELHGGCWGTCFGATPMRISALVKLSFIPVQHADDIVLIHNIDALCYAVQAIKYGDGGDVQSREEFMALAVHELNLELWSRDEDNAQPITNNVLGGTYVGRQQCF